MAGCSTEAVRIETDIPARLDRLPFSAWHRRILFGLGAVWILDELEVTILGNVARRIAKPGSGLNMSASFDRGVWRHRLRDRCLLGCALLRLARRPARAQTPVHDHARRVPGGNGDDRAVVHLPASVAWTRVTDWLSAPVAWSPEPGPEHARILGQIITAYS